MSPEEVIARAIHDLFDPYDKAAAEVTSRILSALKSAGLVVVPEEPTREIIDQAFPPAPKWNSTTLSTKLREHAVEIYMNDYRAMIRAANKEEKNGQ